jgi:hypothetical protein
MATTDNRDSGSTEKTRENIARVIFYGSTISLIVLAVVVIGATAWQDKEHLQDTTQIVFSALLPLLGTWVGTVLAYYFSKDNFQTASDAVRETVRELNVPMERLRNIRAKDAMVPIGVIKAIRLEQGKDQRCEDRNTDYPPWWCCDTRSSIRLPNFHIIYYPP